MKTKRVPKLEKSMVQQLRQIRDRLNRKLSKMTPEERKAEIGDQ
jgi:hypothetical protein